MANASGRAGRRKGRGVSRQVFGAAAPAGLTACVGGVSGLAAAGSDLAEAACAFGASAADGPVPSVSQAASASAAASTARLTAVRIVRIVETETFIKAFQGEVF